MASPERPVPQQASRTLKTLSSAEELACDVKRHGFCLNYLRLDDKVALHAALSGFFFEHFAEIQKIQELDF